MDRNQHWCCDERPQASCYELHVAPLLGRRKGRRGSYTYRCPAPDHADHRESLSINPGTKGQWLVWDCKAGCDPADVRLALSKLGIHDDCLGRYGRGTTPAAKGRTAAFRNDPAVAADAARWRAIRQLPAKLGGSMLKDMCIQALTEGDGSLAGDPYLLLPVDRDDFILLARRAGIERGYAYRVYKQWMAFDAA